MSLIPPKSKNSLIERPPIVVVMGHIDHGKSTLLDFIRKTNVVAGEAGGITQHTYAYEIVHTDEHGEKKRITFLDTPGHEAFTLMRARGTSVADIAILVVAAGEGVKTQTREAITLIKKSGIPYIVAINKIDAPNANVDRVKQELAEHEVYLEGYGGAVPVVAISAKTGEHVPDLLSMVLLVALVGELKGDPDATPEGTVIEAHREPKAGITATLVIKNGTLKKKMHVVAGSSNAPTRRIENTVGEDVAEAHFSTPVRISGWDAIPEAGAHFTAYSDKKEAERVAREAGEARKGTRTATPARGEEDERALIPVVLKADTQGTLDALVHETEKLVKTLKETHGMHVEMRVLHKGVGAVKESDVKLVSGSANAIIAGFNVSIDDVAKEIAERTGTTIGVFSIIYELTDWLTKEIEKKRPRVQTEEVSGEAKILRTFSVVKHKQIIGGKVLTGKIIVGGNVHILRRDFPIGEGKIVELQQQKTKAREIPEGAEFGAMIESRHDIAPGDVIKEFIVVEK